MPWNLAYYRVQSDGSSSNVLFEFEKGDRCLFVPDVVGVNVAGFGDNRYPIHLNLMSVTTDTDNEGVKENRSSAFFLFPHASVTVKADLGEGTGRSRREVIIQLFDFVRKETEKNVILLEMPPDQIGTPPNLIEKTTISWSDAEYIERTRELVRHRALLQAAKEPNR